MMLSLVYSRIRVIRTDTLTDRRVLNNVAPSSSLHVNSLTVQFNKKKCYCVAIREQIICNMQYVDRMVGALHNLGS